MTVFAEIKYNDGHKAIEKMVIDGETSHYRISQAVQRDFQGNHNGIAKIHIFEDEWKPASKVLCPKENHKALAFVSKDGEGKFLFPGWSEDDIAPMIKEKAWWAYIEVPSAPSALEGTIAAE